MLPKEFPIFAIPEEEQNDTVIGLLGLLKGRDLEISKLKDEIARVEGTSKPQD